MKSTGMTRPVDELGRVVIPKEIRKLQDITEGEDRLEIFVEGDYIILRKLKRKCVFCGSTHELKEFGGEQICGYCREDLRKKYREGRE